MPFEDFDYHFPKAGLDRAGPFGRQPARPARGGGYARTSVDASNVVSYEMLTKRDRGGSRPGLSKYVAERVPPERWVIQNVNSLVAVEGDVPGMQTSQSGRVVYLVAVSQGVVKVATPGDTTWTATTNNSGETPALNFTGVMQSSPLNQKLYFCDGTNYVYFNPPTNSVEAWTPTRGTLPRDNLGNGCRIITTWRGRLVMSGLLKDPHNWFMCRIGDALDWEYGADPVTEGDPVAGNSTDRLGLIGDVVTGLVAMNDDVLLIGGDHSLHAMRGDPAGTGHIDLVSNITGMAFGQAWCTDGKGTLYFMGNNPAVYAMRNFGVPERISSPIQPLLDDIDTGTNIITMAWDEPREAFHLFVTGDENQFTARHWTFETRSGSWWPRSFSNTDHNPLCVCEYDGNEAGDRVILTGGWDGYVRAIDEEASTDDGTAISSYVLLGPIMTQDGEDMLLTELQFVLAETSGQVSYEVLAGSTAEEALAASALASGVATAGRNNTQPIRVAGHAIYVKISATTRWAFESVRARFGGRGKVRRRN